MSDLPLIDMIAATVVVLAIARGLWIGLIREGLSLAAIGLCTIVTRLFVNPLSVQVTELTSGEITGRASVWIAGVLLVMATILVCGVAARLMKRGAQFAGLGWADRLGGGALGLAEGAIVSAILVLIALWLVGPDHPATEGSRSVELVEDFQDARANGQLPGDLPRDFFEDTPGREDPPAVGSPGKWF